MINKKKDKNIDEEEQINENPITDFDAISAEKRIKGWSRKKKIALIKNDFELIKKLARCQNTTSHLNFKSDVPFDSAQGDSD